MLVNQPFAATLGSPQPVALQPRQPKTRMNLPQFYQQQQQPQLQQQDQYTMQAAMQQMQQQQQQGQAPSTKDFMIEQFQRLAQRPAVPELDPGARVQGPNMELVQPSNFQTFYDRLGAIKSINDSLLGAAQARSAYQRMQSAQNSISSAYKGSGGSSATAPGVPSNPAANFKFAQQLAGQFGWTNQNELNAWYQLGMKESGWRNTAQNPTSTAYGIGQFLNSTWAGVGIAKTSDPYTQVLAMAKYIQNRYGSPSKALAFHLSHNWY